MLSYVWIRLNDGDGMSSNILNFLKNSFIIHLAKKDLPAPIGPFKSKISPISKTLDNFCAIKATSLEF